MQGEDAEGSERLKPKGRDECENESGLQYFSYWFFLNIKH